MLNASDRSKKIMFCSNFCLAFSDKYIQTIFCVLDRCQRNTANRIDCGYFDIDKRSCYSRGCCYDNSMKHAPPCFYKKGEYLIALHRVILYKFPKIQKYCTIKKWSISLQATRDVLCRVQTDEHAAGKILLKRTVLLRAAVLITWLLGQTGT